MPRNLTNISSAVHHDFFCLSSYYTCFQFSKPLVHFSEKNTFLQHYNVCKVWISIVENMTLGLTTYSLIQYSLLKLPVTHANSPSFWKRDNFAQDIGSMSVVMYLDDFGQPGNRDSCCPNEFRSQSSGVRVAIHDKRTPPDTTRGIAISPGSETTIAVSEIDRHRLSEPYGDCTHAVYVGTSNDSLGYSLDVCQQLCHQNSVYASISL